MKNLLYLVVIAALFTSCGGSDNKNEFRNDFDQIADWGFNSPMLKKGDAHSGVYYCGMDSTNDFSLTFQRAIKDLPKPDFKKLNISAWVRSASLDSKASLIVSIDSQSGSVKYVGISLLDFAIEPNKWTEIKGTLEAPANVSPDNVLKVYLYNAGKEKVDIDDIRFDLN
jgi:hypothetical protein